MTPRSVFLFISPHLDDVVFSCGGYIRQLTSQSHEVVIVTVATADDSSGLPLSWLARRNIMSWGGQKKIFALRCSEDRAAAQILGAQALHLGYMDCIFRRDEQGQPLYNDRVIAKPVHPFDWKNYSLTLQQSLTDLLSHYTPKIPTVFCPLTIGEHVDHLLVRQAVEAVTRPEQRVYYEDFPYILRGPSHPEKTERLTAFITSLSPAEFQAKQLASACYQSQLPGLFPSRFEVFLEILRARLPYFAKLFSPQPDLPGATQRMNVFLDRIFQQFKGERYWAYDGDHLTNKDS